MIVRREIYVTGDGKTFPTFEEARQHQTRGMFLTALTSLIKAGQTPEAIAAALHSNFNISPRIEI